MLRPLPSIRAPLSASSSLVSFPSPLCTRFRVFSPSPSTRMSTNINTTTNVQQSDDVILQYVVLRRDLIDLWPLGSVVTQGCHASVAAVWAHRDHPDTASYCSTANLDSMHKVTLEVKGEQQIRNLSEKLTAGGIEHKMWIEQPENIPTCIATRPCRKSLVAPFFKKLKLCK